MSRRGTCRTAVPLVPGLGAVKIILLHSWVDWNCRCKCQRTESVQCHLESSDLVVISTYCSFGILWISASVIAEISARSPRKLVTLISFFFFNLNLSLKKGFFFNSENRNTDVDPCHSICANNLQGGLAITSANTTSLLELMKAEVNNVSAFVCRRKFNVFWILSSYD